jgi:hypothetical protein
MLGATRSSSGVAMGVRDKGSQAGDEEISESGIGVMLNCEVGFVRESER